MRYRHLAIFVPDLESGEAYYRQLFDLEVILREGHEPGNLGQWAQLPPHKGWEDVVRAGVEIGMVAIGGDDLTLALFPGDPSPGQVFAVGILMTDQEIAGVAARLPTDTTVLDSQPTWLDFIDRYGFHWQLTTEMTFAGAGDADQRWLDL